MELTDDIVECCGNGCNNCVLDSKISKNSLTDFTNKTNVLSSTYVNFRLIDVKQCSASVFQLEFGYDYDQCTPFNKEFYCLNIALANYLMLRTTYLVNRDLSSEFTNFQSDDDTEWINSRKTKHDLETGGDFISRPFTPIDVDSNNLTFKILVKILKHGLMSQYIASLKLGDLTEWKGSYGHFEYAPNKFKSMILITQGVGIAPAYRIVKNVLDDETDETRIHMVACFKNIENILLREELYSMKKFWNFNYTIYLSRPEANSCKLKYNENIKMCRLNKIETSNILNSRTFDKNSTVVICGGEIFSNNVQTILLDLGNKNFVNL